jgi:hypothetical protein
MGRAVAVLKRPAKMSNFILKVEPGINWGVRRSRSVFF